MAHRRHRRRYHEYGALANIGDPGPRRHRRHRRYGAIEVIPGLGDLMDTFKKPIKGTDAVLGGLLALGGIWGVKAVINKWFVGKIPELALRAVPAAAGVLTGVVLYQVSRKRNRQRAMGQAVGAVAAGLAINVMNELKVRFPSLADVVDLRLSGIIINDPGLRAAVAPQLKGIIMDDTGQLGGTDFAALAAVGEPEGTSLEVG